MATVNIRLNPRSCFLCKHEKFDLDNRKCQNCLQGRAGFESKTSQQRQADGIMQDSKGCYVLREVKYADESKGDRDPEPGVDLE
jgi:hypothetical protein